MPRDPLRPEPETAEEFAAEDLAFEVLDDFSNSMQPLRPCPKCGAVSGLIYCKNCHGEKNAP